MSVLPSQVIVGGVTSVQEVAILNSSISTLGVFVPDDCLKKKPLITVTPKFPVVELSNTCAVGGEAVPKSETLGFTQRLHVLALQS